MAARRMHITGMTCEHSERTVEAAVEPAGAPHLTMAEANKLTAQSFTADVDKRSCCAA